MKYLNFMLEHWYFLTSFSIFLLSAIATFTFGRISVRHIEHEMAKEGLEPPLWDKGMGMRLSMYAFTIIRGKADHSMFVDRPSIIKHARKIDWNLAVFFIVSLAMFVLLMAVTYFLFADNYQ